MQKKLKFTNPVRLPQNQTQTKSSKEIPEELKIRRIRRAKFSQIKKRISDSMTEMTIYSLAFNSGLLDSQEKINSFLGNEEITIIDKAGQKAIEMDIDFFIRVVLCRDFAESFLRLDKKEALEYAMKYVEDVTSSDKKEQMLKLLRKTSNQNSNNPNDLGAILRTLSKQKPESPFLEPPRKK